jgi:hypothetical protein
LICRTIELGAHFTGHMRPSEIHIPVFTIVQWRILILTVATFIALC